MRTRYIILVFAATLLLVAAVYWRAPIQFLRAESGWYLSLSHSSEETQRDFRRGFFTHSYGGHYTPLAFLAEFETARSAGTSRTFWKSRQLIALAGAGTAIFAMVAAIGAGLGLGPREQLLLAAALAATAVFQPQMADLVTWPFMVIQLVWIGLSALVVWAMIRAAISATTAQWSWIAAIGAYASMHVSGLGVATVAGTAAALLVIIRQRRSENDGQWRGSARAVVTMLVLAAAHMGAMAWPLAHAAGSVAEARPPLTMIKLLLGFVARFAVSGVRTFSGVTSTVTHPFAIAYLWPYGVLLIAAVLLLVWKHLRAGTKTVEGLVTSAIVVSAAAGFFALIVLIAGRQLNEKTWHSTATTLGYFTSEARYVVPLHFLLIAPAAIALALLFRYARRLMAYGCVAIVVVAVTAQVEFQATARPYLDPLSRVSHYSVWRLIVATAQECRAAGLPLPNVPLADVTREFYDWDARMFEPLLRRELHLGSREQVAILSWDEYLASDRTKYSAVASLRELEQKLRVKED